ncbi:MAG TPA: F0F1 ATP synthase subunit gamma [Patescibacteria group bacterium]|nr:F0F1 ATP synthase subunit gamma [Patescibacteria group bacterium]
MTTKEINILIEEARSLKEITQAFTQISSSKLKRIRSGAERNREFFKDLSGIYGLINIIAKRRKIPAPFKNGKTLSILLSSNERFYGKITSELIEFFLIQVSKINCDKLVIGRSGVETIKSLNYALSYTPLILKSDFPDSAEFLSLSKVVNNYSKVLVFHPQFQSVMTQVPIIADITQSELDVHTRTGQSEELISQINNFIIEPEVKIMVEFFDNQIKVILLEATFLEAELARTASRLISMDSAQNEAEKYLSTQELLLLNAQRSIQNARILETVAAMHKGGGN